MKIIFQVILKAEESPAKGTVISDSKGRSIGEVLSAESRGDGKWSVLCEADVAEVDRDKLLDGEEEYSVGTKERS